MELSMSLRGRQPRAPELFAGLCCQGGKLQVLATQASWLLGQGPDPSTLSRLLLGQGKARQVAGLLCVSILSCGHALSASSVPDTVPRPMETKRNTSLGFLPL